MRLLASVGKTRKPKFELHLKIYDLNNVPLVSGHSLIKWNLAHSMHAEHRGRTAKCPIANHRVDYGYDRLIPAVRISIDKNNCLVECPLELEVLQEFPVADKITLGYVKLNLSEYVEESKAFVKDSSAVQRRQSSSGHSPTSAAAPDVSEQMMPQDGVVRRYLMQDSKINSTLKISILMVQTDGERNFVAPALRTAPVFGSIAGFMAPKQTEDEASSLPSISKSRDAFETQDLYRRTLAASWSRQPGELPADECIEDIFSGGNGWRMPRDVNSALDTDDDSGDDDSGDDDNLDDGDANQATLRPSDRHRLAGQPQHSGRGASRHRRVHSASSERSTSTVTGRPGAPPALSASLAWCPSSSSSPSSRGAVRFMSRDDGRQLRFDDDDAAAATDAVPTLGTAGFSARPARELDEFDIRDDLVAWKLPSVAK